MHATTQSMFKALVLVFVGLGLLGLEARAQDSDATDRRGTAGAQHLLIAPTARTASLGTGLTSGLTNLNGIEALYTNPAGLMLNTGTSALFSRIEYVADIGVNTFGVAQRIGSNNLAFTVTTWDFGDIPMTTETLPEVSEVTFEATSLVAGLSYARQFTDRISAGVTVKAVSESIDDLDARGVAFDAGMNYVVGETGLRFGVSLKNFGTDLAFTGDGLTREVQIPGQPPNATTNAVQIEADDFELPSLLNFGLSYTRNLGSAASVSLLGNFRSNSLQEDQWGGGLELGLQEIVYVRGGFEVQQDMDDTMFQGWNVGAGLNLDLGGNRFTVDYAYQGTDFFDDVQVITASITL